MSLRDDFGDEVRSAMREWREVGYKNPARFERMVEKRHPVEVAGELVAAGAIQSGFKTLIGLGHPELTIEAVMLRERFKPLFGKALIEAAEWRLKQADKDAPGGESRPGRDSAVAGREGVAREAPQETEQETTPDNSATVSLLDYVREGFRRLEARLDQIAAELVDVRRDMADMKVDTAKRETRIVVWVAGLIGLAVAILSLTLK